MFSGNIWTKLSECFKVVVYLHIFFCGCEIHLAMRKMCFFSFTTLEFLWLRSLFIETNVESSWQWYIVHFSMPIYVF